MTDIIQVMPIPIMYDSGSGGGGRVETLYATLIALNFIFFSFFIIKSIVWYNKKDNRHDTFWQNLFQFDTQIWEFPHQLMTVLFCGINGLALIICFILFIQKAFFNI
jgi:hypothetical protein